MTEAHRCTEQCIEELEGIVEEMQAERNELSCRVVKLQEVLREYASHSAGCLWEYSRCTCGFDREMASISPSKAREGELEALLREVRPHIGDEHQRSWPDDPEFDDMLVRVDAALTPTKAREGEDVGNRPN